MFAIVTETCTENEAKTEEELRARGYRPQTVWIKYVASTEKEATERDLRDLRVAQFLVSSYWGRSDDP